MQRALRGGLQMHHRGGILAGTAEPLGMGGDEGELLREPIVHVARHAPALVDRDPLDEPALDRVELEQAPVEDQRIRAQLQDVPGVKPAALDERTRK